MKLVIPGWSYPIYVYGSPEVRAAVCRDLQRLELAYTEVGNSPEDVADLTLEEGAPLVIALGTFSGRFGRNWQPRTRASDPTSGGTSSCSVSC